MISSTVGVIAGAIHSWTDPLIPRGQAISLSIVGILQAWYTANGYLCIKKAQKLTKEIEILDIKKDEKKRSELVKQKNAHILEHKGYMQQLFYGACLGPFWFRVPQWMIGAGMIPNEVVAAFPRWVWSFVGLIPNVFIAGKAIELKPGQWL